MLLDKESIEWKSVFQGSLVARLEKENGRSKSIEGRGQMRDVQQFISDSFDHHQTDYFLSLSLLQHFSNQTIMAFSPLPPLVLVEYLIAVGFFSL